MKFIGHRGAMGLAPEHSKKGFEIAIAKGIDAIECDVQLTKDGQLVLHHDKSLQRVYHVKMSVSQITLSELKNLGNTSGQDVITVEELLEMTMDKIVVNFELKAPGTGKVLGKLLSMRTTTNLVVSSLNWNKLRKFHQIVPHVRTAKIRRWLPFVTKRQIDLLNMSQIGLRTTLANKFTVSHAHRQGLEVYVWTLSSKLGIEKFEQTGVDLVVIDKP